MESLFNMVKGKQGYKAGKFGSETKLYGSSAISARSFGVDERTKKGKFRTKSESISRSRVDEKDYPQKKFDISERQTRLLASSKNIPVSGLINFKSPTGVLSASKVFGELEKFGQTLKGKKGIEDVSVKKTNGKFTGLELTAPYRKRELKFDPRTMSLKGKQGWKADIPKEFIKTEQGVYKAPEKEYQSFYESETDDETERETRKYTPVKIYVDEDDKLKKIEKKGTYLEKYEKKYDDDYRKRQKEYDVYDKDIEQFFGTGFLKKQEKFDIYEREQKEKERGEKEEEETEYEPYMKSQKIYTPEGYIKSERVYSPYKTKYYRERKGDDKDKQEKSDVYLKKEKTYGDYGGLMRERDYEEFTEEYEKKYYDDGKTREKEYDTYLGEEKIYAGDKSKLLESKKFDLYQTDDKYVDYGSKTVYKDIYKPFMKSREQYDFDTGQKVYEEQYDRFKTPDTVFKGGVLKPVEQKETEIKQNLQEQYEKQIKQDIQKNIPVRYWGTTTPEYGSVSQIGQNEAKEILKDIKETSRQRAKETYDTYESDLKQKYYGEGKDEAIVYGGEDYGLKAIGYYSPEKNKYIYERYW